MVMEKFSFKQHKLVSLSFKIILDEQYHFVVSKIFMITIVKVHCCIFCICIYLLLTEFEGHTVTNQVFSSSIYGPSANRAGHKSKGKKQASLTYSTDWENEVSKIFIISLLCVWGGQEWFLFTWNGFKFLTHLESKTSQFEIVFKSLARLNT